MSTLLNDVMYGTRRLRRQPGFAIAAIISLALGIGANTAAFSLVNATMLRKTPIPNADRVVELYVGREGSMVAPLSYPDYKDLREQTRDVFSQVSVSRIEVLPRDVGDGVETVVGEAVSGDFFPMTGLHAVIGRLLGPEDDVAPGAHPVAVLSYDYWQSAFGGQPSAIGQEIRLKGRPYSIVGVAPAAVSGVIPGITPELFVSIQMIGQLNAAIYGLDDRGDHSLFARARLAPGLSLAQARARARRFTDEMSNRFNRFWPTGKQLLVIPTASVAINPMFDRFVLPATALIGVVVTMVLLVACTNLAGFLLAQAQDRRREIALRLSLGATRLALIRQLLVESLLVAVLGAAAGLMLAVGALRAILSGGLPLSIPVSLDIPLDMRVTLFTLAGAIVATAVFGLVPAIQATRPDVIDAIKSGGASVTTRRRARARRILLVGQTAISLTLLLVAILLLRSFARQTSVDPGFGRAPAAMVAIGVPSEKYPGERQPALIADLERRMALLPGIAAVGTVDNMLLNPVSRSSILINVPGMQSPAGQNGFEIDFAQADSGFFAAAGVRIIQGRGISAPDVQTRAHVAVITEAMARRFWPGQNAIGRTFLRDTVPVRVIGIAANVKIHSVTESPLPMIFGPLGGEVPAQYTLVARTTGNPAIAARQLVTTIHDVDRSLMVVQARTMAQHLSVVLLPARYGAWAVTIFAGIALVLAMTGVYGMVRFAVANRRREVAIRIAIGASGTSVVQLLMREGFAYVVVGIGAGLALGVGAALLLRNLLYGLPAIDPVAFFTAPLFLLAIGFVAAAIPAIRVRRIAPAEVLRGE